LAHGYFAARQCTSSVAIPSSIPYDPESQNIIIRDGPVITLMGFLGGLVMSAIKRDRGVKDWGTMIEGHGGMLDRLDSVCFSAPIFFHVVRHWWTP
jgi:predicted CDP-diglyceride synthetase/phosphatidate cytidylyltransferase